MIIECKNPKVKITQAAFDQASVYNMAHRIKTRYLAVTNGLKHYCCAMNYENGRYTFLKDFPDYE
jgi:hypothetical protein